MELPEVIQAVRRAAIRVHTELGDGLGVVTYQNALSIAMKGAGLKFQERV